MTPKDFFLWNYIKNNVYKNNLKDLDNLKIKIIQEIRSIEKETLKNVFSEIEKRLSFCISVENDTYVFDVSEVTGNFLFFVFTKLIP